MSNATKTPDFSVIFANFPDALLMVDAQGAVTYSNRASERLWRSAPSELRARPANSLFRSADPQRTFVEYLGGALRGESCRFEQAEEFLLAHVSEEVPVEVTLQQLPEEGPHAGALVWIRDITARRRREIAQADVHRARLETARATAIADTVNGLAHESRNALQRSQACLDMLAHRVRELPKESDLVSRLQQAQDRLQQLHEQLQKYAGPVRLNCKRMAVPEVIQAAWENLSHLRTDRQASLEQGPELAGVTCELDAQAIEQVLRNLFENSLEGCPDPVLIRVSAEARQTEGKPMLLLKVLDNGPGFSPDHKHKLFHPFFTTKTRGSGLGLAIVKRLIEAHRGEVEIDWSAPQGAKIMISLPQSAGVLR
ncbi:MAG TPA: ATP-binding protein [Pirellulales bacterium]|jgi:hypothetical protein|nr:ATP-binding protein [Pirellulales bacterium]